MTFFPPNLLSRIVRECGTPTYVYDLRLIESKFVSLQKALSGLPHTICYAVKANSNLSVLNRFARLGSGFDIVSGGELHRVLRAGGEAGKVVFAGVGKTVDEIRLAIASGTRFLNVESLEEILKIEEVAASMHAVAPLGIRINPNVSVTTHPYFVTGMNSSKFGIPAGEIGEVWNRIKDLKSVKVVAVHCHIGSNILEVTPFEQAYKALIDVADFLRNNGAPVSDIDIGGGLGFSYDHELPSFDLDAFGAMVRKLCADIPYHVLIEPGRFLVADCGVLLTEVLYTKITEGKRFAITSAGMNDLIRPSLYNAYHKIDLLGEVSDRKIVKTDIVGPVCETGCFLAKDREISELRQKDILIVRDVGAYGFTMASHYNSRPLAPEVIIESDEEFRIVRKRETFEDLIRHEI